MKFLALIFGAFFLNNASAATIFPNIPSSGCLADKKEELKQKLDNLLSAHPELRKRYEEHHDQNQKDDVVIPKVSSQVANDKTETETEKSNQVRKDKTEEHEHHSKRDPTQDIVDRVVVSSGIKHGQGHTQGESENHQGKTHEEKEREKDNEKEKEKKRDDKEGEESDSDDDDDSSTKKVDPVITVTTVDTTGTSTATGN